MTAEAVLDKDQSADKIAAKGLKGVVAADTTICDVDGDLGKLIYRGYNIHELAKLSTFEGRSRFTTWAYKFAIFQSTTEVRRFAWQHREVELDDLTHVQERGPSPASYVEAADLASAARCAIDVALTPHQRRITIALLIDEVPIDVLAQRLGTNRNALYKTVHGARTRLRAHLIASGHLATPHPQAGTS